MNYGTDLLVINGEIMWSGDTLATVSGLENVKQQAYLRLLTSLGESEFYPEYGCTLSEILAKPFTPENKKTAESIARDTLLQVGTENGPGWIEEVIDCHLKLETFDGQQVKVLYAKYRVRDVADIAEAAFSLGGG
ncbi:DUF2634 domain-containing protein [Brevibacillus sp. HD3.3A]|uniref:DUF2634 domain-containing protein n=1 Tax=Brevibacillus sp. HD3.3A TaxID=2738979 RepID=UPI001E536DF6|nr:DUF2634 domain-containing protein [Brevibacillus sp. HD3.3A]UED70701.1 DUF2634 domain-containing protein [Brevibacillus sp. HD3.3A]